VSREKLEVLHVGIYRHHNFGTTDMARFLRHMKNLKVGILMPKCKMLFYALSSIIGVVSNSDPLFLPDPDRQHWLMDPDSSTEGRQTVN
jgi:hypothetical protein